MGTHYMPEKNYYFGWAPLDMAKRVVLVLLCTLIPCSLLAQQCLVKLNESASRDANSQGLLYTKVCEVARGVLATYVDRKDYLTRIMLIECLQPVTWLQMCS